MNSRFVIATTFRGHQLKQNRASESSTACIASILPSLTPQDVRRTPFGGISVRTFSQELRISLQGGTHMLTRLGLLGILVLGSLVAPAMAVDVTGKWRVAISTSDGEINGRASLKQTGENVTGWVGPSESDPIPVKGTLNGQRLTLKTFPQPGRTVAFGKCEVTVKGNKMIGTIDANKGSIEFAKTTW
jgi:hypothetical protein